MAISSRSSSKKLSILADRFVPDYVKEDHPLFVEFLAGYFRFLEKEFISDDTIKIYNTDEISDDTISLTFSCKQTHIATDDNHPTGSKGHIFWEFVEYVPALDTTHDDWLKGHTYHETSYGTYRMITDMLEETDIDKNTIDDYLVEYKRQYLSQLPVDEALSVDRVKLILKNVREFYKAKGTEASYKFLFNVVYGTDVEFYYPKVDILRASDGRWNNSAFIVVDKKGQDLAKFYDREIQGIVSGARAFISNDLTRLTEEDNDILFLDKITGDFLFGEGIVVRDIEQDEISPDEDKLVEIEHATILSKRTKWGVRQDPLRQTNARAYSSHGFSVTRSGDLMAIGAPAEEELSIVEDSTVRYKDASGADVYVTGTIDENTITLTTMYGANTDSVDIFVSDKVRIPSGQGGSWQYNVVTDILEAACTVVQPDTNTPILDETVCTSSGGEWIHQVVLENPLIETIAVAGDINKVLDIEGTDGIRNSGAVYLYRHNGSEWITDTFKLDRFSSDGTWVDDNGDQSRKFWYDCAQEILRHIVSLPYNNIVIGELLFETINPASGRNYGDVIDDLALDPTYTGDGYELSDAIAFLRAAAGIELTDEIQAALDKALADSEGMFKSDTISPGRLSLPEGYWFYQELDGVTTQQTYDKYDNEFFGYSVSIVEETNGNGHATYLAVGAPGDFTKDVPDNSSVGHVYIYRKLDEDHGWSLFQVLDPDYLTGEQIYGFGYSVKLEWTGAKGQPGTCSDTSSITYESCCSSGGGTWDSLVNTCTGGTTTWEPGKLSLVVGAPLSHAVGSYDGVMRERAGSVMLFDYDVALNQFIQDHAVYGAGVNDRITPKYSITDAMFGSSVDKFGQFLIIGEPNGIGNTTAAVYLQALSDWEANPSQFDKPLENTIGAAHVFHKEDDTSEWLQIDTLSPEHVANDTVITGAHYGYSVSISSKYIVATAPSQETPASTDNGGVAYVYNNYKIEGSGLTTGISNKLYAEWDKMSPFFGASVSISESEIDLVTGLQKDNDRIAISAPTESGKGVVYVFSKHGNVWKRTFVVENPYKENLFGGGGTPTVMNSVSQTKNLSFADDYLFVGQPDYMLKTGTVLPYKNTGDKQLVLDKENWKVSQDLIQKIDGSPFEEFGANVEILPMSDPNNNFDNDRGFIAESGTKLAGRNSNKRISTVHVLRRDEAMWGLESKIVPAHYITPFADDVRTNFGSAMSSSGEAVLIGAFHENSSGSIESGRAYIFETPDDGVTWNESLLLEPLLNTATIGGHYGHEVELVKNYAIVTAPHEIVTVDGVPAMAGAVYIYKKAGTNWADGYTVERIRAPKVDHKEGLQFGYSIAFDFESKTLAVTAINADVWDGPNKTENVGKVFIYEENVNGYWNQFSNLTDDEPNSYKNFITLDVPLANARFGESLCLCGTDGNKLAIGAPGSEDGGSVHTVKKSDASLLFEREETTDTKSDVVNTQVVVLDPAALDYEEDQISAGYFIQDPTVNDDYYFNISYGKILNIKGITTILQSHELNQSSCYYYGGQWNPILSGPSGAAGGVGTWLDVTQPAYHGAGTVYTGYYDISNNPLTVGDNSSDFDPVWEVSEFSDGLTFKGTGWATIVNDQTYTIPTGSDVYCEWDILQVWRTAFGDPELIDQDSIEIGLIRKWNIQYLSLAWGDDLSKLIPFRSYGASTEIVHGDDIASPNWGGGYSNHISFSGNLITEEETYYGTPYLTFEDEGFLPGDIISVTGDTANQGNYTIVSVTGNTIEVADPLIYEAATGLPGVIVSIKTIGVDRFAFDSSEHLVTSGNEGFDTNGDDTRWRGGKLTVPLDSSHYITSNFGADSNDEYVLYVRNKNHTPDIETMIGEIHLNIASSMYLQNPVYVLQPSLYGGYSREMNYSRPDPMDPVLVNILSEYEIGAVGSGVPTFSLEGACYFTGSYCSDWETNGDCSEGVYCSDWDTNGSCSVGTSTNNTGCTTDNGIWSATHYDQITCESAGQTWIELYSDYTNCAANGGTWYSSNATQLACEDTGNDWTTGTCGTSSLVNDPDNTYVNKCYIPQPDNPEVPAEFQASLWPTSEDADEVSCAAAGGQWLRPIEQVFWDGGQQECETETIVTPIFDIRTSSDSEGDIKYSGPPVILDNGSWSNNWDTVLGSQLNVQYYFTSDVGEPNYKVISLSSTGEVVAGDEFGASVESSGDYLLVGAPGTSGSTINLSKRVGGTNAYVKKYKYSSTVIDDSGAVYIFNINKAGSPKVSRIEADFYDRNERFGERITVSDDYALITSRGYKVRRGRCTALYNDKFEVDSGVIKERGFYYTTDGFLDSSKVMQDNFIYQEFSYMLDTTEQISEYREVVKDNVHPVGMQLVGLYNLGSKIDVGSLFDLTIEYILNVSPEASGQYLNPTTFRSLCRETTVVYDSDLGRYVLKTLAPGVIKPAIRITELIHERIGTCSGDDISTKLPTVDPQLWKPLTTYGIGDVVAATSIELNSTFSINRKDNTISLIDEFNADGARVTVQTNSIAVDYIENCIYSPENYTWASSEPSGTLPLHGNIGSYSFLKVYFDGILQTETKCFDNITQEDITSSYSYEAICTGSGGGTWKGYTVDITGNNLLLDGVEYGTEISIEHYRFPSDTLPTGLISPTYHYYHTTQENITLGFDVDSNSILEVYGDGVYQSPEKITIDEVNNVVTIADIENYVNVVIIDMSNWTLVSPNYEYFDYASSTLELSNSLFEQTIIQIWIDGVFQSASKTSLWKPNTLYSADDIVGAPDDPTAAFIVEKIYGDGKAAQLDSHMPNFKHVEMGGFIQDGPVEAVYDEIGSAIIRYDRDVRIIWRKVPIIYDRYFLAATVSDISSGTHNGLSGPFEPVWTPERNSQTHDNEITWIALSATNFYDDNIRPAEIVQVETETYSSTPSEYPFITNSFIVGANVTDMTIELGNCYAGTNITNATDCNAVAGAIGQWNYTLNTCDYIRPSSIDSWTQTLCVDPAQGGTWESYAILENSLNNAETIGVNGTTRYTLFDTKSQAWKSAIEYPVDETVKFFSVELNTWSIYKCLLTNNKTVPPSNTVYWEFIDTTDNVTTGKVFFVNATTNSIVEEFRELIADGAGNLTIEKWTPVGTIDYITGTININNLRLSDYISAGTEIVLKATKNL